MIIINLGTYTLLPTKPFGMELSPYLGVLFISAMFFGIYGAIGSTSANFICDLINGYSIELSIASEIVSFLVIYLGYKLWYTKYQEENLITRLRLNNTHNLSVFFLIVIICGILYSLLTTKITYIFYPHTIGLIYEMGLKYFVNFVDFSLIFSTIGIWITRYYDFVDMPPIAKREFNPKLYKIIDIIMLIFIPCVIIADHMITKNYYTNLFEVILILLLIAAYNTKPIKKVDEVSFISIPERIIDRFLGITFIIIVLALIDVFLPIDFIILNTLKYISKDTVYLYLLLLLNVLVAIFFIPTYFIIRYIEKTIVKPLISFSKIESRIKHGEIIESNDLLEIYSKYAKEDNEIGMLSRSYIDLVKYNNDYIENIKNIETEKQRIKTELRIARNIQNSILPTESIKNENYCLTGFSQPAKEVGGDFYDYYELDDEQVLIVIGDSSGKGVPAAIFSTIIQNSIEQLSPYEKDPAKMLYSINNNVCKKNTEVMFITLWIGIYNKNTHELLFSNAGHNPPLVKEDDKFVELEIESGLVLGIYENFEYKNEKIFLDSELLLYTDGITDAQNDEKELYCADRMINFLNSENNKNTIKDLIDNINDYCGNQEQYDDMTLVHLKIFK